MTALLLLAAALAQDEGESRDDEIFGSSAPAPASEEPVPQTPLDAPPLTDAGIASMLQGFDQRLTLGGKLYLRANAWLPSSPTASNTTLDSPNLLDLFADARPNDLVRGYAQVRVKHDPTVEEGDLDFYGAPLAQDTVTLDQLYLNADVKGRVFVTAGRQRIKWGAGRFWNPTDFLDPARLDPLAFFDERTGVPLVKVHLPFERAGANLYAIADLEGARTPEEVGGALRAEWLVGLTEISLSTAVRKDDPLRLGGQVSTALGPVDLKVEGALLHGDDAPYWEGTLDWESLTFPTEVSREDDWIPQVVANAEVGIRYNDEDSVYLGAEAFWNDAGYDDPALYPWLLYSGQFQPFYLGRLYGAAYVFLPGPGRADDLNLTLSTLGNLSDQSFASRVDLSARVLTQLSVNSYVQGHWGETGELRYSLEIPAVPGVFDEAISVPEPLVEVGVGAFVTF